MLLSSKLSLFALSLLCSVEAHRSLISSTTSSGSGSTSVSGSTSGSRSSSDSDMYTASSKSSGSGSSSDSSDETDIEVISRCQAKNHAALIINERFGRRLAAIADYFEAAKVRANFVVNGADLVNSLNRKSRKWVEFVNSLSNQKHGIVILPDNLAPVSELNPKQFLRAVQVSAIGIQGVIGYHPRLVHVPGGLGKTKADKKKAALLKEYGYSIVQWNQDFKTRAKDVKNLNTKRSKKSSHKHKKSKKSHKSRKSKKSSRRNVIEYESTTTSSSSDSSTSTSSESRSRSRHHVKSRKHRKARGHIFYGHIGRSFKTDIPATVKRLQHRGYKIVDLQRCSKKELYRPVDNAGVSQAIY